MCRVWFFCSLSSVGSKSSLDLISLVILCTVLFAITSSVRVVFLWPSYLLESANLSHTLSPLTGPQPLGPVDISPWPAVKRWKSDIDGYGVTKARNKKHRGLNFPLFFALSVSLYAFNLPSTSSTLSSRHGPLYK